ncbi:CinA family protein [Halosimplex salinum]|uniref:CinA family protein n=1 Tax=Halosimplex salinum TaxID=1710538 RepID=UPI000F4697BD|nr:CinA family protein [Halosimplex salinum]
MFDDRSAAERLGDALESRGETLAVAESCTGGLLGSTITGVPGSSAYFVGGVLAYTDRTKRQLLAVSRESLERHGAVSETVASAMARHVRDETGADWGVSTTGYAGPTTDDPETPVGTVFIGIAYAGRDSTDASEGAAEPFAVVEHHQFDGTREEVKERIVEQAVASLLERV